VNYVTENGNVLIWSNLMVSMKLISNLILATIFVVLFLSTSCSLLGKSSSDPTAGVVISNVELEELSVKNEEIIEEIIEEIEEVEEIAPEKKEIVEDLIEDGPIIHTISLSGSGFPKSQLFIHVGDTVEWRNERTGRVTKALIIGAQLCRDVRSKIYETGESYSYKFNEPTTCTIVDGMYTTKTMKIVVGG
jgi:plastocyanin